MLFKNNDMHYNGDLRFCHEEKRNLPNLFSKPDWHWRRKASGSPPCDTHHLGLSFEKQEIFSDFLSYFFNHICFSSTHNTIANATDGERR